MKGLIFKILIVLCIVCLAIGGLGCAEHRHVWVEWVDQENNHIRKCATHGCEDYDPNIKIVKSESSAEDVFKTVQDGQIVYLKNIDEPYRQIVINESVDNLIITAEEGTTVKEIEINASCENLMLQNLNFVGVSEYDGVEWSFTQYNITLYRCSFTGTAVIASNLSHMRAEGLNIIECEFINVKSPNLELPDDGLTAILSRSLKDLVIKDSTFIGVQYNVIQVGQQGYIGDLIITGNTFKDIGSRVLYFAGETQINTCDISNNKFYDNTDCPKDGVYLKTNGKGIVIGKNYWENIPDFDKFYFNYNDLSSPAEGISYDKSQQELIQS